MTWEQLEAIRRQHGSALTEGQLRAAFFFLWGMLEQGGHSSSLIADTLRHAIKPASLDALLDEATADAPPRAQVIDLLEALKASLRKTGGAA